MTNNDWSRRISTIINQRKATVNDKDAGKLDIRDLETCEDEA